MKLFVTVLAITALVASSAVAKTVKAEGAGAYQSHAQGYQSYPNPDRVFGTGNEPASQ